jgi:hypothetical protein
MHRLRHVVHARDICSSFLFNRVSPLMDTAATATSAATAAANPTAILRDVWQTDPNQIQRLSIRMLISLRTGPAKRRSCRATQASGMASPRPRDAGASRSGGRRDFHCRARAWLARRSAGGSPMIQLLCGCQTPMKWRCTGYRFCRHCPTMIPLPSSRRSVCAACREQGRIALRQQINRDALQCRREMILARVRFCVVCGDLLKTSHPDSGSLRMPRLVCSNVCRVRRAAQRQREKRAALKLLQGPTVRRARERKGRDPEKYAARRQRSNAARRRRRLVVRAVREFGLFDIVAAMEVSP